MALPFDALTAALDAWLGQHIPNATRRARVRRAVDCLDDLRSAPLAHIEFATDVTYADVLAQQRSFVRSMRNPLPESLMLLKSMRTYGTRALRLTTDPPPGWTEVMLLTEHQEPVGRRSFQR
jgi:hypothetical protein